MLIANYCRKISYFVLLTFVFLSLGACSTVSEYADSSSEFLKKDLEVDFAYDNIVYEDVTVTKSPVQVQVYPKTSSGSLKALFVPLRVTQKMDNPETLGYSISKGIWQSWAQMEVFEYLEFVPELGPFRKSMALELALAKNADILISGYVTDVLSGGSLSMSRLSLQLEIYDVHSGMLIWSLAQGGIIESPNSRNYILYKTKYRMPFDPIYVINNVLANDMGAIVKKWSTEEE